jgi:hypothetical protein
MTLQLKEVCATLLEQLATCIDNLSHSKQMAFISRQVSSKKALVSEKLTIVWNSRSAHPIDLGKVLKVNAIKSQCVAIRSAFSHQLVNIYTHQKNVVVNIKSSAFNLQQHAKYMKSLIVEDILGNANEFVKVFISQSKYSITYFFEYDQWSMLEEVSLMMARSKQFFLSRFSNLLANEHEPLVEEIGKLVSKIENNVERFAESIDGPDALEYNFVFGM